MINLLDYYENADDLDLLFANIKFIDVGAFDRSWELKDVPFELLTSQAMLDHIRQMSLTPSGIAIGGFEAGSYDSRTYSQNMSVLCATIVECIENIQIGTMEITLTKESRQVMIENPEFKCLFDDQSVHSNFSNILA